jgi:hypothetical protein
VLLAKYSSSKAQASMTACIHTLEAIMMYISSMGLSTQGVQGLLGALDTSVNAAGGAV